MIIVFVHGWSVTNVNTYGELPIRLRNEAAQRGVQLEVTEIFLGKYISFHDEVRLEDISTAFVSALRDSGLQEKKFVCITHSTGGPVIRDWWKRFYPDSSNCPMSHLIMLAPANHGSALAQLGKARVGRLKSWLSGVDPGQGVLDWLELGSNGSWNMNKDWALRRGPAISANGPFPFVLTGQTIDRKLYDHLNSYTGENGSDGVVRAAAANLNNCFIRLTQAKVTQDDLRRREPNKMEIDKYEESPITPFRIIRGKSHSDKDKGIMASVKASLNDRENLEIVDSIFACISVNNIDAYNELAIRFKQETFDVQADELIEYEDNLLKDRFFIHDRCAMVIFKVVDSYGYTVKDYDLVITADNDDPNALPEGFFVDRQRNKINGETITYYFNADVIYGVKPVIYKGKELRPGIEGIDRLGLEIRPRPDSGFVRYHPCRIEANSELLQKALVRNSTTLVEVCLDRIIYNDVFRLDPLVGNMPSDVAGNFDNIKPGNIIA